jgi:hypothetical protein
VEFTASAGDEPAQEPDPYPAGAVFAGKIHTMAAYLSPPIARTVLMSQDDGAET